MKSVWKYPIKITDEQQIEMPQGARILSSDMQGDQLCLWVLVDKGVPNAMRTIRIHGTGHAIQDAGQLAFIDTVQMAGGRLIWHVFEKLD